jgi:hypothetical protein
MSRTLALSYVDQALSREEIMAYFAFILLIFL